MQCLRCNTGMARKNGRQNSPFLRGDSGSGVLSSKREASSLAMAFYMTVGDLMFGNDIAKQSGSLTYEIKLLY